MKSAASNNSNSLMLLSDEPIKEVDSDGLNIKSWAHIIANVARGTDGPFAVGVFGSWGVGKTSVLQLSKSIIDYEETIKDRQEIITVLFNAWQYEKEDIPLIPLISAILSEIETRNQLGKRIKSGLHSFHYALRSILFAFSADIKGDVPGMGTATIGMNPQNAIDRYEKLRKRWIDKQIEKSIFYNALNSMDSIDPGNGKIVVFIDDLDRCLPDRALNLLESIKLILFHSGIIFVLAIDKEILESYLDKKYREEFGLLKYQQGQSYLDKLIQLPLWLPEHNERFSSLITKLLGPNPPESGLFTQFAEQFGPCKEKFESLHETLGLASQFKPRQLVRILNQLLIDQAIYPANLDHKEFPLEYFLVARGIRHQNEGIYHLLINNNSICKKLNMSTDISELHNQLGDMITNPNTDVQNKTLFHFLIENICLCKLLLSDSGSSWLEKDRLFKKKIDRYLFEETQFDRGSEYRFYREKQIVNAIAQLDSKDHGTIMAGCNKLAIFGNPLPSKAFVKLKHLLKHNDHNVKREANNALVILK